MVEAPSSFAEAKQLLTQAGQPELVADLEGRSGDA